MKIPGHLIVDPLAPIPASLGKKDRERLHELRAAYVESMAERFIGAKANTPEVVSEVVAPIIAGLHVESLIVIGLNPRQFIIAPPVIISRGDTDGVDAPVRACLRAVLVMESVSWIMAHNHPSGDPSPSAADIQLTRRMVEASRAIDCMMQDHVVIGGQGRFTSLRRNTPECWR